jgi:hypothetical protein
VELIIDCLFVSLSALSVYQSLDVFIFMALKLRYRILAQDNHSYEYN